MQKVYLLLRNNRQTGPYTLDELLQLNLKPFDLVWMEGRSAAWRYPGEIESLKPFVPETPAAEIPFQPVSTAAMEEKYTEAPGARPQEPVPVPVTKKIFVSMPGKAPQVPMHIYEEPPPADAGAAPTQSSFEPPFEETIAPLPTPRREETGTVHTAYSRPLSDVEEDYTRWVYGQKTKKKKNIATKDLLIAACVAGLIVAGYFMLSQPALIKPAQVENSVAASLPEAAPQKMEEPQLTPIAPVSGQVETENAGNPVTGEKPRTAPAKKAPTASSQLPSGNRNETIVAVSPAEENEPVVSENDANPKVDEAPQRPAKKEKKGLREVVKDIFGKRDKKESAGNGPVETEEPRPAKDRQATRRGDTQPADEASTESDLASSVNISSNAPENWMMGVRGLKVTLHNRNAVALQTAAVTVFYYSENNELLDKKSVYFSNVPAKGKATAAAPDHKFADHVEFKLSAVSGKDDRYARE